METNSHDKDCVKVAVNIRPLITTELLLGCTDCVTVVPGEPQVQIGSHVFTFDHVYGSSGSPCGVIYEDCVAPLVDALFHGYNATVLAYGQTGSGKTYTMGTNYTGEANSGGIIPKVIETIFSRIGDMKDNVEFLIRVAFIELNDDIGDDILCAKLHLVDLAGSNALLNGEPMVYALKEGIHINKGLLALGNVISALGDDKKRKEGGHVPYRDSKLTRLLQDSLGGNSKTVMIACVSPADSNAEETLNTLKYANRARNIQNKAIINRDPMTAQMQRMRSQVEQLQAELLYFRGEGGTPSEELQILRHKISLLEASNSELHRELRERQLNCEQLAHRAFDAQVEKDKLLLKIESARNGKSWDEIESGDEQQDCDLVKSYVSKIQELEGQLLRLQSLNDTRRNDFVDCLDLEDDGLHPGKLLHNFLSGCNDKDAEVPGEADVVEKELEHSSLQDKLDQELKELDNRLQQKEAEMKSFATVDTSALKQHYEKKLHEMEQEKKALMREIDDLRSNISNISSASDDGAQKLKETYLQKLNFLEAQVSELKKKQDAQSQLLRQKQKSDEAAKRLQDEIHRIKTQKVQLQQKIKQESEQFRLWKASREKEVLQLKKEGRRNEYEMHKLLALNQRQKMVLQRKTEEASMATKRLKELLEARKASSRVGNGSGPGIQALMQAIEHELEVMVRVHEVRSEYEKQMNARAVMAKEVAKLKEEAETLKQKAMRLYMSLVARIIMCLASLVSTFHAVIALRQCLQVQETLGSLHLKICLLLPPTPLYPWHHNCLKQKNVSCLFSGKGRWNQVRSLPEAKNAMNHLFNLASSLRCLLRDKEVDCREKDSIIRELKEKIVRLTGLVRQLEVQKEEFLQKEKLRKQKLIARKHLMVNTSKSGSSASFVNFPGSNFELLEDMDISDSDLESEIADEDWEASEMESDLESGILLKKRSSRTRGNGVVASHQTEGPASHSPHTEEPTCKNAKPTSSVCCSCSRRSFCKTDKCECRGTGSTCGESCGCAPNKCTNREDGSNKTELYESPQSETSRGNGDSTGIDDTDRYKALASQGAMLLQSALSAKPNNVKNEDIETRRRPLSDIGNTEVKSNAPRPNRRKKWKKSVIQLVPVPPLSSQSDNTQSPTKPENNMVEQDVPLRLPRAMRSATSNNDPLRERNSVQADECVGKRVEGSVVSPNSPTRQTIISDKENHGI
ncbi:hypothetical protein IFM89_010442 [Coptis chinensis]|uniref:Kinesin motor domain-containing protein n=1 Tax=Coptis chinensis TaxID=261450 RepID=A0A835I275_9MAGN|nr:hypothetical protein IFM89_010442 [Coptis chinensis]